MANIKSFFVVVPFLLVSNLSFADDANFGCKALICFAGGQGVAECRSVIRDVLKRLARGKPFPHCSFISNVGSSSSGDSDDAVSVAPLYNTRNNGSICPDGETKAFRPRYRSAYYCRTIEINIKPSYVADPSLSKQHYYYDNE